MTQGWTHDRDERLTLAWQNGWPVSRIADALETSRGAVTGRAGRLGLARRANPCQPVRTRSPYRVSDDVRQARTDLAELMASGCPSVAEASRRMGITQSRGDQHWQAIKAGLGVEQCR